MHIESQSYLDINSLTAMTPVHQSATRGGSRSCTALNYFTLCILRSASVGGVTPAYDAHLHLHRSWPSPRGQHGAQHGVLSRQKENHLLDSSSTRAIHFSGQGEARAAASSSGHFLCWNSLWPSSLHWRYGCSGHITKSSGEVWLRKQPHSLSKCSGWH